MSEYVVSAVIAIAVSAPLAVGFGLAMKHARTLIGRVNAVARGLLGGVGTGVVAIALSAGLGLDPRHVLGMGDWTLRELLGHGAEVPASVWLLVVIVLGKMLTTAFTVQSGGSAGLLFPSMMLGGVAGAATARALALVGVVHNDDVSLFVVVGVASALVALVGVPLAAIAMSLELFGPQYGPPTILACGLTYVLTLRLSVYDRAPAPSAPTSTPPQPAETTSTSTPQTPQTDSTG